MRIRIIIILVLTVFITNCKKVFFDEEPQNTPEDNFELFWQDFNRNYAQFLVRNIDWDSVYTVYRPQVNSNTTNIQLFKILSDMVYIINDMHVNLFTPYGNVGWKSKTKGSYPESILINPRKYIIAENNQDKSIFEYGLIKDHDIGYIYIKTFSSKKTDAALIDSRYNYIDVIMEKLKNKKGIIIDVRANNGGEMFNIATVASRFADERRNYAKYCIKNGPGKNDFSEWHNQFIEPSGNFQYKNQIVVITSRATCSAAEQFTLAMNSFPYVTTIGDTTGGGFGVPMYRELANGWSYRLSTMIGATKDGFIIEGKGITPDITEMITKTDSINGIDRLIEKGIEIIETN